MAKSGYYPSISIMEVIRRRFKKCYHSTNMNIGVGVSWFKRYSKNGTNVKIAESKALEIQNSEMMLTDYIKIQVQKPLKIMI
jgi:hypothetical protein